MLSEFSTPPRLPKPGYPQSALAQHTPLTQASIQTTKQTPKKIPATPLSGQRGSLYYQLTKIPQIVTILTCSLIWHEQETQQD